MKSLNQLLALAITIVMALTSFTSCKKYEEGPALSLKGKKARVSNEWKIDYAIDYMDGVIVTQDYYGETWEFTRKGEFTERDNGVIDKIGTWEFVSGKEGLQINRIGTGNSTSIYTILRLKEKELWLIDKDEELHLVPK